MVVCVFCILQGEDMNTVSRYIALGHERLHCRQSGRGRRVLLAFHGYGNDAGLFDICTPYLDKEYIILSFDLPHHGGSGWPAGMRFSWAHLDRLLATVMAEFEVSKVSLLGYSMGGRVCLSIVQHMPQLVDKVTLVAADGLRTDAWYNFLTNTPVGKKVFHHFLGHPRFYFSVIKGIKNMRIIHPAVHRFIVQSLQTPKDRDFLQRVWPDMSALIPDPASVRAAIRKYQLHVCLFMGLNDHIIPASAGRKFKKGMKTVELHILDKGHRMFDQHNTRTIAESLL